MTFMRKRGAVLLAAFVSGIAGHAAWGADQTTPGAGNAAAVALSHQSPLVQSAAQFLVAQAGHIHDATLRTQTLDILKNPRTCVMHRRGLGSSEAQDAVIQALFERGLISRADAAAFAPGVRAGVFPPILAQDSDCPQLPQPMSSAPGSVYGSHHSYPGGLVVHESNNDLSDVNLLGQYQAVYGTYGTGGLPVVGAGQGHAGTASHGTLPIDADVIFAAPLWHDWAKSIVFQWNADGSEFAEFNFGGAGTQDAWGEAGDSRTGAHHILSVAESMARGLSPLMVITQASAHSAPTLGNEYKVVNWLRAAAIIARIDPVQAGYLVTDSAGHLRLPPLGKLGEVDLVAAGQPNVRVEYTLHNLSDADYTYSGPAVSAAALILAKLAPEFGYDAADVARFNTHLRNPALSYLGAEHVYITYAGGGLDGVRKDLQRLRKAGVI